jgi:hypothetical protein
LVAVIAACNSSTPMPRAASAVGSTLDAHRVFLAAEDQHLRHALDGRERRGEHLLDEGVELRERRHLALQRQQQDRRVGRVDLAVARRRRHLERQLPLRPRDRRLHVGRGRVDVAVQRELDRDRGRALRAFEVAIESMPAMVANCLISGVATEVAMVSGEAPGSCAETLTTGNSARGSAATGRERQANSARRARARTDIRIVATGWRMQKAEMRHGRPLRHRRRQFAWAARS